MADVKAITKELSSVLKTNNKSVYKELIRLAQQGDISCFHNPYAIIDVKDCFSIKLGNYYVLIKPNGFSSYVFWNQKSFDVSPLHSSMRVHCRKLIKILDKKGFNLETCPQFNFDEEAIANPFSWILYVASYDPEKAFTILTKEKASDFGHEGKATYQVVKDMIDFLIAVKEMNEIRGGLAESGNCD